ncbi:MAG: NAD+ synthase/NAD+ synthase (glutamine-hydrolysing) [Verrucomicrobia bacterium]|nr:MAG: NAD+ synthase/NAD+ synthase (glutamine-hydrolysing) [Verrucomicrobiota bacterium]
MKIGFAQINPTIGDIPSNREKILAAYRALVADGADIVLTPELALTGYPPLDLLFESDFVPRNLKALDELAASIESVPLIVGYADFHIGTGNAFRNAAAVLQTGQITARVFKSLLPTYDVFDEARYFEPANQVEPVMLLCQKVGITLCEDIWNEAHLPRDYYPLSPVGQLVAQGATLILNLSASPFTQGKPQQRLSLLSSVARQHQVPIAYCNSTGANDQLVFDGNSLLIGADGYPRLALPAFLESNLVGDLDSPPQTLTFPEPSESLYHALVLGVRDYLSKCGFRTAVLGLSGGIDSAVTACIAAEAIGPQNVLGVTMPTRFSSCGSVEDSEKLAYALGLEFLNIPIAKAFDTFQEQFTTIFAGLEPNETEENMQPRLRGMTLMALSNKFGHLVLSTGNKSELAVGYCTLYGDMCGGLAVISDVPKVDIYALARWINRHEEIIPQNTIDKPPSAELKPDQRDQDTLPPYEILDPILRLHVEEQRSCEEIIAQGFDPETVRWVLRRVRLNEYKRAQAAPGLKVTTRAFGLGRRMPIAHRYEA